MTTAQILMLASDALAYDAVVVLWVSRHGTQPILMPRTLGQRRRHDRDRTPAPTLPMAVRRGRRAAAAPRPVEG